MAQTVAGLSAESAVAALEENLWDMWAVFGRGDGCTLIDTPEVLRFETPIARVPYNSVLRFRAANRIEETIDEVLGRYFTRQVPLLWLVHPTSAPQDIDTRLEARGLVEAEVCPGMIAALADLPTPDPFPRTVQVEELGPAGREDFFELVAWRYSLPPEASSVLLSIMENRGFGEPDCPTKAWAARVEGQIVSKVVIHLGAGVAGLYGVATRSEARGLGLARNLTAMAFAEARRLGYEVGVLHSTPVAVALYRSLGFSHAADFRLFSTPKTLHL